MAGVASERDLLVIQGGSHADDLLALFDEAGVVGKQLHVTSLGTPASGLTLVVSRENLHDEDRFRRLLESRAGHAAALLDGLGAVSAVGAGITATFRNLRAGSAALRQAGIEPAGLATSSFRITWLVPRDRVEDAVRAVHEALVLRS